MASLSMMPLFYISFVGEIVYLLRERLEAYDTNEEDAVQVLYDILSTALETTNPLDDIVYSSLSVRRLLERIMQQLTIKPENQSLDRMLDLIIMSLKWQWLNVKFAKEVFCIVLQHLDAMRALAKGNEMLLKRLEYLHLALVEKYGDRNDFEFMKMRESLLAYLQSRNVVIQLFVEGERQSIDGTLLAKETAFLPPFVQLPGFVNYYDDNGNITDTSYFTIPETIKKLKESGQESGSMEDGIFELNAFSRGTVLGLDSYKALKSHIKSMPSVPLLQPVEELKAEVKLILDPNRIILPQNLSLPLEATEMVRLQLSNLESLPENVAVQKPITKLPIAPIIPTNNNKIEEDLKIRQNKTMGEDFLLLMDS